MAVCTGITKVETMEGVGDLLKVEIDGTTEAFWFFDFAEAQKYLNQEVIVKFRKDIYKQQLTDFISTFVVPCSVSVLDKDIEGKLYTDQVDNFSNISFNDLQLNETKSGCIVYCVSQEYKSSPNAVWMELLIRDRSMRVAKLRIFDYVSDKIQLAGGYVITDLRKTGFGFQAELTTPMNEQCPPNPEIAIGRSYVQNHFANDVAAMDYCNKTGVLDFLENAIDYEKGYGLMRLAMELAMCESLSNITKDVNIEAISQALLASRGHLIRESSLSATINNVNIAAKFKWCDQKLVLQLLDECLEEKPKEYPIMKHIKDMVNVIIETRKGVTL